MTRRNFLIAALAAPLLLRDDAFARTWQDAEPKVFAGEDVFASLMEKAKTENWHKLPMGELVGTIGQSFIGTPYVAFTLELFEDKEVCVVNLAGLDCATLYEASLALARTIKTKRRNEDELRRQITRIRYRDGKLRGYTSRLHYASDYFYDNDHKNTVRLITSDLPGAELFTHRVGYMSANPTKYRQLKADPSLVPIIKETEDKINARRNFYVPKDRVADIEQVLKTGDIVGLTTTMEGLDCSHTGMCVRDADGVLRLLHASSVEKKVVLGPRLSEYLAKSKVNDGIMIVRPVEL